MANMIGQRFGPYQIISVIGRGGMGEVYLAQDTRLNRQVAIKVLPMEAARQHELRQRFRREASAAANLDHPNIIDVYDLGDETGLYYIVMRYVDGRTLNVALQQDGPFPPRRVLRIVEQLADALDYAHQRGIIHRDIKPANVMLERDDFVTLTDFGIAHAPSAEKLTRIGQVMGTAGYMAPEQAAGQTVDHRADVYALGVLTEEMLTGLRPEFGQAPAPTLPPAIRDILACSRAGRVSARYPSVRAFYQELYQALANMPVLESRPADVLTLVLDDGREYPLQPGVLRLGRAPENDIVLPVEQISRHHAEIHTERQRSVIIDLNSTNGVFVDDQRLIPRQPHPLVEGARVRVGTCVFTVVARGASLRPVEDSPSPEARQRDILQMTSVKPLPDIAEYPASTPPAGMGNRQSRNRRWWWLFGGGVAALLIICLLACVVFRMFGLFNVTPAPTREPSSAPRQNHTLPVQETVALETASPAATLVPTLRATATRPLATATLRPTRTATPRPVHTATPTVRPSATTPPSAGNVFEFVNYTNDQSCHFEFWGPAAYSVDVAAGSSKTITNIPNGEYGWKTFITGVGESRGNTPVRMTPGGRCTITCSKRNGNYYTGSTCTP